MLSLLTQISRVPTSKLSLHKRMLFFLLCLTPNIWHYVSSCMRTRTDPSWLSPSTTTSTARSTSWRSRRQEQLMPWCCSISDGFIVVMTPLCIPEINTALAVAFLIDQVFIPFFMNSLKTTRGADKVVTPRLKQSDPTRDTWPSWRDKPTSGTQRI